MNRTILGAAVAACIAVTASTAWSQTTIRVASWLPPSHPLVSDIIVPWTQDVNKATEGRVVMELLKAPLGPPPAHFDFAVNGVADVTYGVHNYTPGRFVATQLAELPFLSDTSEHLSVAYWRVHEKHLAGLNEHKGTQVLGVFTHGPGQLWTKGRDLTSMSGIEGSKIRIGGGVAQDVSKALNLVPVQAPVTKAYELLSGGVADGIQFPAESVAFFNIQNVVDSGLVVAGGMYNVSFFVVMNGPKWDSLSVADKDAIMSVSGEALARKAGKAWDAADARGYEAMEEKGINIVKASGASADTIKTSLSTVTDTALKRISERGLDAGAAYEALKAEVAAVKSGN